MANAKGSSPAPPTDRDKLQRSFDSVFEDIDAFLTERDDDKREECRECLGPLCVMKRIEYKIQIAWGGPEYGFELTYDPEGKEWVRGVFYWADWFEHEEAPLSEAELDKVVEAYSMDYMVD